MYDTGAAQEFAARVTPVLQRFCAQNHREPPSRESCADLALRLWSLVEERGLPRPLAPGECGTPGGMSEEECAPLVARVMADVVDDFLANAVKQLVKACFYPEFTVCRDSFREPTKDGGCKRQELDRVRGRIPGTHCIDCPYWVSLAPATHREFVAHEWRVGGREAFEAHREIFLPEDFRALRQWLHAQARVTH